MEVESLRLEKKNALKRAHQLQKEFQEKCKKYCISDNNRASLYYSLSLQIKADIGNEDLQWIFVYAICDAGYLALRTTECEGKQLQMSFYETEKRVQKFLSLLQREREIAKPWNYIVHKKKYALYERVYSEDYDEELTMLCSLFRDTFEMSEKQSQELSANLQYLLMETRSDIELGAITPLYLFQMMIRHTNRLAQNPDFQASVTSLWKYKEYEIEKNNGKNFSQYEKYIVLFQKLCKYYKHNKRINIELCRYGMEHCSNLSNWASLCCIKGAKKCTTKLHRFVNHLYLSCIDTDEPAKYSVNCLFPHKKSEEEALFYCDLNEKMQISLSVKQYIYNHIEFLIQFMKCHYQDTEKIKCMIAEIYHESGFDKIMLEDIREGAKLSYIYEQLTDMLDDAILESVWQVVEKMVEHNL